MSRCFIETVSQLNSGSRKLQLAFVVACNFNILRILKAAATAPFFILWNSPTAGMTI